MDKEQIRQEITKFLQEGSIEVKNLIRDIIEKDHKYIFQDEIFTDVVKSRHVGEGVRYLRSGDVADRPEEGEKEGATYYAIDENKLYNWDGDAWQTATPDSSYVTLTGTQTLTNKRITKRVGTTADSATPTPDADSHDVYTVTALAQAATFGAPTGTPTNAQPLVIRIKDNGTARALSFNAIYRAGTDIALPTTTVLSKTMYLGFIYNSADSVWDLVAKVDNI